jgi:nucleotide-binding universal stress UspA family protein
MANESKRTLSPKLSQILVATDFSDSADAALRQAAWLAKRTGARITLMHVLSDVGQAMASMPSSARWELVAGDINKFERELRRRSDDRLAKIAAKHRKGLAPILCHTLLGVPFIEIIHAVQKDGHDLVIAGTRGISGVKRFFLGSTAERLVRQCPCPVWIVKRGQEGPVGSVLVAVDFSEVSGKALRYGASLAAATGASLDVVHALFIPAEESIEMLKPGKKSDSNDQWDRCRQALKQDSSARLSEFVQAHVPSGQDVRMRIAHGQPWKIITKAVQNIPADLIVMGTMGRSGIPGLLIGSTADKVLRSCNCSILTVKPDGFESPIQPPAWSLYPAEQPSTGSAAASGGRSES